MTGRIHATSGFSPTEEHANTLTHGIAFGFAAAGWVFLIVYAAMHSDILSLVACTVYGFCLCALYLSSTLYHGLRGLKSKKVFLVLDHCAIYLLIAGTYTPFALGPLRGGFGWTLFGIIWGLALIGIIKECLVIRRGGLIGSAIYLGMGWFCLIAVYPLYRNLSSAGLLFLFLGGVAYSAGVVFYLARRMRFHHAFWHLFVVLGSAFHYISILTTIDSG